MTKEELDEKSLEGLKKYGVSKDYEFLLDAFARDGWWKSYTYLLFELAKYRKYSHELDKPTNA